MRRKRTMVFLIFLFVIAIIIFAARALPFLLYQHAVRWAYCVDNFDDYQSDFSTVAHYCSEYVIQQKQNNKEASCQFFYTSQRHLFYDIQVLQLPDEVQSSVERISQAFTYKDSVLHSIYCYGEEVYFCIENGQYALVYSPLRKPSSLDGNSESDVFVKKIQDGWYHVVRNNH